MQQSKYIVLCIVALLFASCNRSNKMFKDPDPEKRLAYAQQLYETKRYESAIQLYESLIPIYRGTDKAEIMYYQYSDCYYQIGDFVSAAFHFNNFAKQFSQSSKAEEAAFLAAYCTYLEAPEEKLDQSSSKEAITQFQYFVNLYPESKHIEECNKYIDEIREKLASKSLRIAKLYNNIYEYRASRVLLQSLLQEYAETSIVEEAMFVLAKNEYEYASKSVVAKKEERFRACIEHCNAAMTKFPESKYQKELKQYADNAYKHIAKLNNNK